MGSDDVSKIALGNDGNPAITGKKYPASRPEYLYERTYRELVTKILNGDFHPGEHLREEALVESLGVSRSVVRQVLTRLTAEGMVTDEPKKGKSIAQIDQERIAKLVPIRIALEQLAVREAIAHLTEQDERDLRTIASQLLQTNLDLAAQGAIEVVLHRKIWEISGNTELMQLLGQVTGPFHLISKAGLLRPDYRRNNAGVALVQLFCELEHHSAGHQTLVDAICQRDVATATQAVADHVNALWCSSPPDFENRIGELLKSYLRLSPTQSEQ